MQQQAGYKGIKIMQSPAVWHSLAGIEVSAIGSHVYIKVNVD